ncbi:RepA [Pseudomonas amygdali pv. mori]|uniref:RepA n=1 Tax=Pseudomonas amygdali pv. mori TaxID=34065 RepID=A0A3M5IXP6_PSEA0|nr:RepA [Pseudomonas amygdali pv. mori]
MFSEFSRLPSYTHILTEVAQPATVSVLRASRKAVSVPPRQDRSPTTPPVQAPVGQPADGRASSVQYGVHQISAVPQGRKRTGIPPFPNT